METVIEKVLQIRGSLISLGNTYSLESVNHGKTARTSEAPMTCDAQRQHTSKEQRIGSLHLQVKANFDPKGIPVQSSKLREHHKPRQEIMVK